MSFSGQLFASLPYLGALAETACVTDENGWVAVADNLPLYIKSHSWGEFVFDFAWANAYAQHGLSYYPKLVACVPFTPVVGPRLLGHSPADLEGIAKENNCSSAHLLFANADDVAQCQAAGWLPREDVRFVWRNAAYDDFDDFLSALAQKKAKNIRRERRRIKEAQASVRWCAASDIPEALWPRIYQLYAVTYQARGQAPYLNMACLQAWALSLGKRMQFCLAEHDGALIAMALFFVDGDTLYGRHWGADAEYHSLHFELCYYQGIEYAIRHGLACFDAGVQGPHKLARGFDPQTTVSMHWIANPQFRAAIANWLQQERQAVQAECAAIDEHSAYKAKTHFDL